MKVGDKVRMPRAWVRDWEYPDIMGTIHQINTNGWVVVRWDELKGDYHYSPSQAEHLEILKKDKKNT